MILFFVSSNAQASQIKLKSGKIVDGDIVQRNEEMIKVDVGFDITVTYYWDEIDLIDGEPIPTPEIEPAQDNIPEIEDEILAGDEPQEPYGAIDEVIEIESLPVNDPEEHIQADEPVKEMEPVNTSEAVEVLEPITITDVAPKGQMQSQAPIPQIAEPIKDIDVIDDQNLSKEPSSPFGPKIAKPEEVQAKDVLGDNKKLRPLLVQQALDNTEKQRSQTSPKINAAWIKNTKLFIAQKLDHFKHSKIQFQQSLLPIKKKLEQIPVKIRRDILVVGSSFAGVLYFIICFPFMMIAKKLNKKYIWLAWVPVVHLFYFVYMSNRPLWWSIFFVVPIVNVILPFVLFISILRALHKPSWLFIFTIIPIINIIMIWYLAFTKTNTA